MIIYILTNPVPEKHIVLPEGTNIGVPPAFKMHRGEHGVGSHSYSGGVLSVLAEAYYGLEPWNASLDNDELLMPNIKRPKEAFFLSEADLEEYYRVKGWK